MRVSPSTSFLVCIIGSICGDLLQSCGSTETHTREMSKRRSESHAKSGSIGSSRGSMWRERRHKRHEDNNREQEEKQSGLGEGSHQTHRTMSGALGHRQFDEKEEELKHLCRLVRDLELEAGGRHRRRNQNNREGESAIGEIATGLGLIGLVPVDIGTAYIRRSPVNVGTIPAYENIQARIQIPQKSGSPVMPP